MSIVQLSPELHSTVKSMKKVSASKNVSPYLLSNAESDAVARVFYRTLDKKVKEIKSQWD